MGIINSIKSLIGLRPKPSDAVPLMPGANIYPFMQGQVSIVATANGTALIVSPNEQGDSLGPVVTPQMSLSVSAVFACIGLIADAVATLPVEIVDKDMECIDDHPLLDVLENPNEYMDGVSLRTAEVVNFCVWGDAYSFVDAPPDRSFVNSIMPIHSEWARAERWPDGHIVYAINTPYTGTKYQPAGDMLHHKWLSLDGLHGESPVMAGNGEISLAAGMRDYARRYFARGGILGGIVTVPPNWNETQIGVFRESFKKAYQSADSAFKTGFLPHDMKYEPIANDPDKSQLVEARKAQVIEIARLFRIPPHKLGLATDAPAASVEAADAEFYSATIRPLVTRYCSELTRKLLPKGSGLKVRLNMDAMLRPKLLERYQAYAVAIQNSFLTPNECREKEGYPPEEGGDKLLRQLNMTQTSAQPGTPAETVSMAAAEPAGSTDTQIRSALERRATAKEAKAMARIFKKLGGDKSAMINWAEEWYADNRSLLHELGDARWQNSEEAAKAAINVNAVPALLAALEKRSS